MLIGIKEPSGDFNVTGTVKWLESDELEANVHKTEAQQVNELKLSKNGVILTPQPSLNPNDPLNWPLLYRDTILAIIGILSFLCGGLVGILAPAMGTIQKAMHDTPVLTTIAVNGVCMVGLGIGDFFLGALARVYAKRPMYLCTVPVLFAGLVWCATSKEYYELILSRLLQGIGACTSECLVSATIGEIYFVHERGFRLALYTLLYLGGKNLWPTISGSVVSDIKDWHWVFWISAIIAGALWVLIFVFVHETTYERPPSTESQKIKETNEKMPQIMLRHIHIPTHVRTLSRASNIENTEVVRTQKEPFYKGLKVTSGRRSTEPFLRILFRPIVLYGYLPVLFSGMLYASSVVWLSIIAETISSIFSSAPYHFSQKSIGLLYIALFIGGVLGSAGGGRITEYLVKQMCHRHDGWFEPEFRLVMIPVVMVTMSAGLIGFGWSAYISDRWIVPSIFLGILGFGTSLSCTIAIQYVLDCYRELTIECLISLNVLKNVLGFVFSCFVPQFLHKDGDRTTFIVYGCVCMCLCVLALPMYRYGKCCRHHAQTHDWAHIASAKASRI